MLLCVMEHPRELGYFMFADNLPVPRGDPRNHHSRVAAPSHIHLSFSVVGGAPMALLFHTLEHLRVSSPASETTATKTTALPGYRTWSPWHGACLKASLHL